VVGGVINSTVRFRCRRPSHVDVIRWNYYRHSVVGNVELYNGHRLSMKYHQSGRYGVQCTADECLLTINTVQTRDQGEYSCFFPRSRQKQDFWLLVVGKLLVLSHLILELCVCANSRYLDTRYLELFVLKFEYRCWLYWMSAIRWLIRTATLKFCFKTCVAMKFVVMTMMMTLYTNSGRSVK